MYNNLYDYQREGILWMWGLYKLKKGGVLGDDTGLGKTIQVIAFLCGLVDAQEIATALIVMPLSLIINWQKEFEKWAPGMKVRTFHGNSKKVRMADLFKTQKRGGVCLTTYGIVQNNFQELGTCNGADFTWDYVILDDGHKIKNPNQKTSRTIHAIRSKHRLVLTGTPIQNNLKGLWSLYDFTHKSALLGTYRTFKTEYENPITRARQKDASAGEIRWGNNMSQSLQELIKPYFLRRSKAILNRKLSGSSHPNGTSHSNKQELLELFILDNPHHSATQELVDKMHAHQRVTDVHLDAHIAFIYSLDLFGISDHNLMFTKEAANDEDDDGQEDNNILRTKVEQAKQKLALESDLQKQTYDEDVKNPTLLRPAVLETRSRSASPNMLDDDGGETSSTIIQTSEQLKQLDINESTHDSTSSIIIDSPTPQKRKPAAALFGVEDLWSDNEDEEMKAAIAESLKTFEGDERRPSLDQQMNGTITTTQWPQHEHVAEAELRQAISENMKSFDMESKQGLYGDSSNSDAAQSSMFKTCDDEDADESSLGKPFTPKSNKPLCDPNLDGSSSDLMLTARQESFVIKSDADTEETVTQDVLDEKRKNKRRSVFHQQSPLVIAESDSSCSDVEDNEVDSNLSYGKPQNESTTISVLKNNELPNGSLKKSGSGKMECPDTGSPLASTRVRRRRFISDSDEDDELLLPVKEQRKLFDSDYEDNVKQELVTPSDHEVVEDITAVGNSTSSDDEYDNVKLSALVSNSRGSAIRAVTRGETPNSVSPISAMDTSSSSSEVTSTPSRSSSENVSDFLQSNQNIIENSISMEVDNKCEVPWMKMEALSPLLRQEDKMRYKESINDARKKIDLKQWELAMSYIQQAEEIQDTEETESLRNYVKPRAWAGQRH